jgi:hypothetical protein
VLLAVLMLGPALVCPAEARTPVLRFTKPFTLESANMRIKLMPNATEVPLPALTAYTYANSATDERFDLYDPEELWRRSQHLAEWRDNFGTTMKVLTPTLLMPGGFDRAHVSREQYDKAVADAGDIEWTPLSLPQWLAALTGVVPAGKIEPLKHSMRMQNLAWIPVTEGVQTTLAYFLQFRRSDKWFVMTFKLGPGVDPDQAHRAVQQQLLATSALNLTGGRRDNKDPSSRFQLRTGSSSRSATAELQRSRTQVIENIRNLKSWWYVETPYYVIMSNLGSKHSPLIKRFQQDMPHMRRAYTALVPPRTPIAAVSVIRVFATDEEYASYVPEEMQWTAGLWYPGPRELVIRPIEWGRQRDKRKAITDTLYHEAFHQYLFHALDQVPASMWFNEGHAVLFEGVKLQGSSVKIVEAEGYVDRLVALLEGGKIDLKNLVHLSPSEFYGDDQATRQRRYAVSWGLVYYLRKGTAASNRSPYGDVLNRYVDALWDTRSESEATAEAFSEVDFSQFQADFTAFWGSRNLRSKAEKIKILGRRR